MPEGHTIHRLARDLNLAFEGSQIQASSPQGRFDAGASKLDGQVCDGFEAFGKHLVGHFAASDVLHVHLGLIGKFRKAKGDPVGAVRLRLATNDVNWDLRGPMVCDLGNPDLVDKVARWTSPSYVFFGTWLPNNCGLERSWTESSRLTRNSAPTRRQARYLRVSGCTHTKEKNSRAEYATLPSSYLRWRHGRCGAVLFVNRPAQRLLRRRLL